MGGNRISVQMAKYENRSTVGGSSVRTWRNNNRRSHLPGGDGQCTSANLQKVSTAEQLGAWAVKEDSLHVVKVADVVNFELKKALCDSFVVVAVHSGRWKTGFVKC